MSLSEGVLVFAASLIYCFDLHFTLRLAAIKQLLCVHSDAIKEYKLILDMQQDYVPALKGNQESLDISYKQFQSAVFPWEVKC